MSRDIRSIVVGLMSKGLEEIVAIICYAPSSNTDDHNKILCKALGDHIVSTLVPPILPLPHTVIGLISPLALTVKGGGGGCGGMPLPLTVTSRWEGHTTAPTYREVGLAQTLLIKHFPIKITCD